MKREGTIRDVGRLTGMIHNGIHREIERSEVFRDVEGMTGKNGWIIAFLAHNQHRTICQKDVEKAFNVTRSTASKVLTLMEKKGFVERRSVEKDARLKEIVLTESALELAHKMDVHREIMEAQLTRGFSEEEREQLLDYLNRILDNICICEGGMKD